MLTQLNTKWAGRGEVVHEKQMDSTNRKAKDMAKAGVASFKIEGRMKSGYYLATVINAYRRAMNGEDVSISEKELLAVAHRDYTTAYAKGKNSETVNYTDSQSKGDYTYIADVEKSENGYVYVQMRNRFKKGDVLEVLSPDNHFRKTLTVEEVFDAQDNAVDDCKLVQAIYKIKCPLSLQKGDYLRRKNVTIIQ